MSRSESSKIVGFHDPNGEYGCFSNWYMSSFTYAGAEYNCVEQYMMLQKVKLGHKFDLVEKILSSDNPAKMKEYGSKKCFPEFVDIQPIWDKNCRYIVKRAVRAKFVQNPEILKLLLSTGDSLIAECAGQDRVWGIGISMNDKAWKDVNNWNGKNYLGIILMELRDEFRNALSRTDTLEYIDYMDESPTDAWKTEAGVLRKNPKYYEAIHAYADQLPVDHIRNSFYGETLERIEDMMRTNMGGGLPIAGFYDMKQDVYEIEARSRG